MPSQLNQLYDRLTGAHRLLSELTAHRKQLNSNRESIRQQLNKAVVEGSQIKIARSLLQKGAQQVQDQLRYRITNIASMAFSAIMDDPYQMEMEFISSRGTSEAQLHFLRDGISVDPLAAAGCGGGGAVDIAAFGLRMGMLNIQNKRGVVMADEPFRFMSANLQPRAATLLRTLSSRLKIQLILVTHEEELRDAGDIVFLVERRAKISSARPIPRNSPTLSPVNTQTTQPAGRRRVV